MHRSILILMMPFISGFSTSFANLLSKRMFYNRSLARARTHYTHYTHAYAHAGIIFWAVLPSEAIEIELCENYTFWKGKKIDLNFCLDFALLFLNSVRILRNKFFLTTTLLDMRFDSTQTVQVKLIKKRRRRNYKSNIRKVKVKIFINKKKILKQQQN